MLFYICELRLPLQSHNKGHNMSTKQVKFLLVQPLSNVELAATSKNDKVDAEVRTMASLLLTARMAREAGDYYTAAQAVAAMKGAA